MEGAGEERLDSENPILRCEALTDDFRTVVLLVGVVRYTTTATQVDKS